MASGRDAERNLRALDHALSGTYRDFLREDSQWPTAFFSDTLVVAAPVTRGEEAFTLEDLIDQARWLQLALVSERFFVRGALTLGRIHLHGDLTFGPALVQAYGLESQAAVHPRIVLSKSAEAALRSDGPTKSPLAESLILRDDDGHSFVNYLGLLLDEPYDVGALFALHQDRVLDGLTRYRSDRRRWNKYRWVADYHNHVTGEWEQLTKESGHQIPHIHTASGFAQFR
ncbi:MAG TPA: hypothetical protein VK765_06080 [Solirubrobacteraceae bacterium]|jgi:hypothetical protein|nr:hypothetical protein [Solirubrobacteraceae bacterium]